MKPYNITEEMTNIEVINEFMNWGSITNQMLVIEAVYQQSKLIVENQDLISDNWNNPIIHPQTWIQSAKDFIEIYELKYGDFQKGA